MSGILQNKARINLAVPHPMKSESGSRLGHEDDEQGRGWKFWSRSTDTDVQIVGTKLSVGNLSYEIQESDIRTLFQEYGTVESVELPRDKETGRLRGFAFVVMAKYEEALAAMDELDGTEWMGRNLRVKLVKLRQGKTRHFGFLKALFCFA